jgi:hypothetical protein
MQTLWLILPKRWRRRKTLFNNIDTCKSHRCRHLSVSFFKLRAIVKSGSGALPISSIHLQEQAFSEKSRFYISTKLIVLNVIFDFSHSIISFGKEIP